MNRTTFGACALALAALAAPTLAQAQLFGGDDQARQAILDLRQRFDQAVTAQNRLVDENTQMRRAMLDLQQQIEAMRADLAASRGQQEQAARDIAELREQLSGSQGLQERVGKLEGGGSGGNAGGEAAGQAGQPGGEGMAAAVGEGQPDYDAALAVFRAGDYKGAQTGFAGFIKRYPRSALAPSALFWLGNAQYATGDYREAVTNFRALLTAAPSHPRAPEAMLSIANCQIELKDQRSARATLESLLKTYPKSEAAQAGKERLARMK
jgi:tol-pal system protein YbgF